MWPIVLRNFPHPFLKLMKLPPEEKLHGTKNKAQFQIKLNVQQYNDNVSVKFSALSSLLYCIFTFRDGEQSSSFGVNETILNGAIQVGTLGTHYLTQYSQCRGKGIFCVFCSYLFSSTSGFVQGFSVKYKGSQPTKVHNPPIDATSREGEGYFLIL